MEAVPAAPAPTTNTLFLPLLFLADILAKNWDTRSCREIGLYVGHDQGVVFSMVGIMTLTKEC